MNDLGTLILIGIIVVAVVLLMQRLMNRQPNYSQPGNEYPHTDNPNISSHGGFGGQPQQSQRPPQYQNRPQNDNPNISSHGGFGGGSSGAMSQGRDRDKINTMAQGRDKVNAQSSSPIHASSQKEPERNRENDDPNVSSHGGFGRQ